MFKMLTVLVSTVSNSHIFLLKKCEYSHFFSKNVSVYAIFNDQKFKRHWKFCTTGPCLLSSMPSAFLLNKEIFPLRGSK